MCSEKLTWSPTVSSALLRGNYQNEGWVGKHNRLFSVLKIALKKYLYRARYNQY